MKRIESELIETLIKKNIQFKIIEGYNARLILEKTALKFTKTKSLNYPMWDNLNDWLGIDFAFSWEWLPDFIKGRTIYLFTDQDDIKDKIFIIENGDILPLVLQNCSGFTFYITNLDNSYLICYNDHDNLIVCGEAVSWLANYEIVIKNDLKIYQSEN
ncbi:MAG: hypothetical protein M0P66_07395 [Salinivirgaceae bacterium]|nr:hypothetical protein [Salinivirgaceae bacterium]